MTNRLIEIQSLIDKANHAYHTDGDAIMEDARYDRLKEELKSLNPSDPRLSQVGASVNRTNILQKKTHTIAMGSQGKALNEKEFRDWFTNNILKNGISKTASFHASYKMDGASISLEYKNGKLISGVTRGDGKVGLDITANALKFKNVPAYCKLPTTGEPYSGFVRGEVVLLNKDWKIVDPDVTSNPRNMASGIVGRKDGTESENLSFYSFRMFDNDGTPYGDSECDMSYFLTKMGFDVAPYIKGNIDEIWQWYLKIQLERPTLNFWIDGIVVKLDDIEKQLELGESSDCPYGQVAIKFESKSYSTVLREVTIQVGSTGAITPVATFDSVRIDGTDITNANLCNWNNIATLDVCIGDEIQVIKAGDIIPRIMEVSKKGKTRISIPEPKVCPCCEEKTGRKLNTDGEYGTSIYCLNLSCPAIVRGKIDKYLSSLDILGIGETVIESLVKDIGITTAAELYTLHTKRDRIADIVLSGKVRLGEKRTDKFLEEIDKKRELTLSDFLGSLGIFGLGKRRVALIQEALSGKMDTLDDWFSTTLTDYAQTAGVPNIASRIHADIIAQKSLILDFVKNGVIITKPKPKQAIRDGAYVICITGKLSKPKSYYEDLINTSENVYTDTFNKDVTHLVAEDVNSGSAKLKKATKQGTKVIGEDELLKLIK